MAGDGWGWLGMAGDGWGWLGMAGDVVTLVVLRLPVCVCLRQLAIPFGDRARTHSVSFDTHMRVPPTCALHAIYVAASGKAHAS